MARLPHQGAATNRHVAWCLRLSGIRPSDPHRPRPERGRFRNDAIVPVIACVLYVGIVWIHDGLDHPALIPF